MLIEGSSMPAQRLIHTQVYHNCSKYMYVSMITHTYIHTYITWHDMTWHDITLHYINTYIHTYITWHYMTLHDITWHDMTLHYINTSIHTYIHYIYIYMYICTYVNMIRNVNRHLQTTDHSIRQETDSSRCRSSHWVACRNRWRPSTTT